ncbi:uncharacterized protein LOC112087246 [Eutrema salsugineum]|uniref:uncharacterized protein LOC112087246 n=1 Tax=Eutrema salsugineum TaxID=72664 RepID=UPI000CED0D01|nr:uncharacterized protein LOC112087246 [Eutrema salsugineum]
MVVVDGKNQTMHMSVKKEFIRKYENLLEEDMIKIFTNFQHGTVYKIQFASTTSVKPAEELDPTVLGLKFVSFTNIHDGKLSPDFLIAVVGQIVSIGKVEILNVNKKQTKRLTMTLSDASDIRLNCVLCGNYAENLESVATNSADAVIVFVLRFGKLHLYQVDQLMRTISEITAAFEVAKCVTTIMSIDTEFGWFYMSCNACAKNVLPRDMDEMRELYPGRLFPK